MLRNPGIARLCLRAHELHRWAHVCALLFALWPAQSLAEPVAPELFCSVYPTIPDCEGKIVNCAQCHVSVAPVAWNGYGQAVLAKLSSDVAFEQALPDAVHAIEQEDSDGDGLTNLR
ncbi:MAG TPA: hypothetical protein VG963_07505, partial [Polyangiaceae bacterium]|nr:hypothetical protein [Polyangiaceae bacterium]